MGTSQKYSYEHLYSLGTIVSRFLRPARQFLAFTYGFFASPSVPLRMNKSKLEAFCGLGHDVPLALALQ